MVTRAPPRWRAECAVLFAFGVMANVACDGIFGIHSLSVDEADGTTASGESGAGLQGRGEEGEAAEIGPSIDATTDGTSGEIVVQGAGDVQGEAGQDGTENEAEDAGDSPVGAEADDGSDSGGDAAPGAVVPAHLRLWLTADHGLHCESGRVTSWADQSGNRDDAVLGHSQLGPQCQVAGHAVSAIDLPYFSAPTTSSYVIVDETLDVDLQFLAKSDYTLFVVERRWADAPIQQMLGTTQTLATDELPAAASCSAQITNVALGFGYYHFDPTQLPSLALDQSCNTFATADAIPPVPPALREETGSFDRRTGHRLWRGGALAYYSADVQPLSYAAGGAIGRALVQTTAHGVDTRFHGDIAEVLVYDAALTDADRTAVEDYLQAHWVLGGSQSD